MKKIYQHIQLLIFYTRAKLEAEAFRHFAGYLWWILDPIFGVGIYYLLFRIVRPHTGPDFIPFLLIGLSVWKWIGDGITKSSGAILGNLDLIRKIKLSSHIFPVVEVMYNTWKFLIIFSLIVVGYAVIGYGVSLNHFALFPLFCSALIFILGVSVATSSIVPFLPDMQFFISYSMRLIFYPSGVLFALDKVPEQYKIIILLNPIANLIQGFRDIVISNLKPSAFAILYPAITGVIFGFIGFVIIKKNNQEYPKLY